MAHDLRALTREWFEAVWNRKDDGTIDRLASPTAVGHGLTADGRSTEGLDHFRAFRTGFHSAFPDLNVSVEDVLLDGDKTAVRVDFTGTHTGDGIGIPPTGRPFKSTAIVILRWADGKIAESWNEFDAAGMMRQLSAPDAKLRA